MVKVGGDKPVKPPMEDRSRYEEFHGLRDFALRPEERPIVYVPGFGPDDPPQVSMTRQEFADECDINVLMAKYERVDMMPMNLLNSKEPQYLDLTDVPDLMRAHDIMREGEAAFMRLPAKVRREFDNDPMNFVSYASAADSDPEVLAQMREWGLAAPVEAPGVRPGDGAPLLDGAPGAPKEPVAPPPGGGSSDKPKG